MDISIRRISCLGILFHSSSRDIASCKRLCSWGLCILSLLPYLFTTCLFGERSGEFEDQSRISKVFWFFNKEIHALLCCPPLMLNDDCWCLYMPFELERKCCKNFYIFGPPGYLSLQQIVRFPLQIPPQTKTRFCLLLSHSKQLKTIHVSFKNVRLVKKEYSWPVLQSKGQKMPHAKPSGDC